MTDEELREAFERHHRATTASALAFRRFGSEIGLLSARDAFVRGLIDIGELERRIERALRFGELPALLE